MKDKINATNRPNPPKSNKIQSEEFENVNLYVLRFMQPEDFKGWMILDF
ncbi:MAG TPA: hypothetical protein VJS91_04940 [Nitrososphaeraceae archaeon]|nr:hypothetical protein [Nitrososphaeraceae archaeon]